MSRADVITGIGDDAAVVSVPDGMQLVVSTDLLVEGVHFPKDTAADAIGYKSLAVNLSDMAAMGANPAWFTLTLSLPDANEPWLTGFCEGLFALAQCYTLQLVGGDTVRGPLAIGIQISGLVPLGQALLRSGAGAGDNIYVTGTLGDAGLALQHQRGKLALSDSEWQSTHHRLQRPDPRVSVGQALRGIASSAIDISDGLAADLGHILSDSGVGATIQLNDIPTSAVYQQYLELGNDYSLAVTHGDDYELCITVPADKSDELQKISDRLDCRFYHIGSIDVEPGLRWRNNQGGDWQPDGVGYDHFMSG